MAKINFKSVGTTGQELFDSVQYPTVTPIGIKTPLKLGREHGIFEMHLNLADTVHDNLRNLILTNWGERVGLYFFGANLRSLTTEYSKQDDFDTQAVMRIKTAVKKWMPYVELIDYVASVDQFTAGSSVGRITIDITYSIQSLNSFNRQLSVTLHIL